VDHDAPRLWEVTHVWKSVHVSGQHCRVAKCLAPALTCRSLVAAYDCVSRDLASEVVVMKGGYNEWLSSGR
jgi:hypothetical protein